MLKKLGYSRVAVIAVLLMVMAGSLISMGPEGLTRFGRMFSDANKRLFTFSEKDRLHIHGEELTRHENAFWRGYNTGESYAGGSAAVYGKTAREILFMHDREDDVLVGIHTLFAAEPTDPQMAAAWVSHYQELSSDDVRPERRREALMFLLECERANVELLRHILSDEERWNMAMRGEKIPLLPE